MKTKSNWVFLIASVLILNFSETFGQEIKKGEDAKIFLHKESQDDEYLPNAFANKKFSPAYKLRNSGAVKTTSSGIFTTQVNVSPGGQNILDDAANEPSIAVNPLDRSKMVIGWRQFDNVSSNFRQAGWSYSSDAGLTWNFPGRIEQGIFRSDPVLDFDASGNFYYNSLSVDTIGAYVCKVFKSNDGGASWNNGTDAAGGDKQWMAIDRTAGMGNGNIYSYWSSDFSSCYPDYFTRSTNGSSSYENCTYPDGDPVWGTMAIGNAGELYICGAQKDTITDLVVLKSVTAQTPGSTITWNAPVSVFMDGDLGGASTNPEGLLGQANIDVDRSNGPGHGNVYVLASVFRLSNPDPGDVMFSRSSNGGLTWSPPVRVNDDVSVDNTQWFATMSVAPNGRIDAVWLDTRDGPFGSDYSALYYSFSTDEGNTWSVNEKLSPSFDPHVGYPDQFKMGDYFDMISDSTGAHLAWANTLNGEQDVYYSYITPPNTVGIHEFSPEKLFSVFPNPTKGVFIITGPAQQAEIEIYNAIGEKVFSVSSSQIKTEIDLSSKAPGIYFLKIVAEDGSVVVKKLIKE